MEKSQVMHIIIKSMSLIFYVFTLYMIEVGQQCFCKQPQDHSKFFRFCLECAQGGYKDVFYCMKCSRNKYNKHRQHFNNMGLRVSQFTKLLQSFVTQIQLRRNQFLNYQSQQHFKSIIKSQPQIFNTELVLNDSFRNFIVEAKFWKFSDSNYIQASINDITKLFCQANNSTPPEDPNELEDEFAIKINWGSTAYREIQEVEELMQAANQQYKKIQAQKKNLQIMIRINCAIERNEISECLKEINLQIQNQPKNWVLYLAKLNLMELHKENYDSWKQTLEKLCQIYPKFKSYPLYTFFQSFKYWSKNTAQEIGLKKKRDQKLIYFVNPQTKNYFILENPENFIKMMTEIIVSPNMPKNGLYYGHRAIGYMMVNKHNQALKDFQTAIQKSKQLDSVRSNMIFQKLLNHQPVSDADFLERLEQTKCLEFLMNAIKYFKKQKQYITLVLCCQKLLKLNSDNLVALKTYGEANLKVHNLQIAEKNIRSLQEKKFDPKELNRLKRKFQYAHGREYNNQNNHEMACEKFQQIVQQKQSASACFNYAYALFKNENFSDAYTWINKAIALKDKKKYQQLKFYINLMRREFEEAKQQGKALKDRIGPELQEFLDQEAM